MAFSNFTGTCTIAVNDNPAAAAPSSSLPFGSTTNQTAITAKATYTIGGNVLNGVNEVATGVQTITASGSATFNLQSLTDLLGATGVVLVRLKRYFFWLLSTNDDATAGTNCTGVTIGNAGSNPNLLNMGGTTPTFTLTGNPSGSGDKQAYLSSTAAGITVSASVLNVKAANNDGTNAAALYYNFAGSTT